MKEYIKLKENESLTSIRWKNDSSDDIKNWTSKKIWDVIVYQKDHERKNTTNKVKIKRSKNKIEAIKKFIKLYKNINSLTKEKK